MVPTGPLRAPSPRQQGHRTRQDASASFAINTAWAQLSIIAHDLLARTRLLALDGDLARSEPKRLRYCLLHTAGRTAATGRRPMCRLAADWPWTPHPLTAFGRVQAIPLLI